MKVSEKAISVFAIISLFLIIIILPLRLQVFNENFYQSQFVKNGAYEKIGADDADAVLDNLLLFFRNKAELSFFEEEEKSHLVDVKSLLQKFFGVLSASFFLAAILLTTLYFMNKAKFLDRAFKIVFLSGMSAFVFIILLLLAYLNFSVTFQNFHSLFFPQGNYEFPLRSLLITMFPESFFKTFFLKIILSSLLISIAAMIPQLVRNKMKN